MMNLSKAYRSSKTNTIFTGINKLNKKCNISLSFSTLILIYNHRIRVCQHPGQNKYRRILPFFTFPCREIPARPAGQQLNKSPQKTLVL
jgi:hypothetical protein